MKPPKRIELTIPQVDALRRRVAERSLEEADYLIIEGMIETILFLSQALEETKLSIKRLLQRIFGIKTESSKKVLGKKDDQKNNPSGSKEPPNPAPKEGEQEDTKSKGHGRNGAQTYTGAEKTLVPHETLKSGDACPLCLKGNVINLRGY